MDVDRPCFLVLVQFFSPKSPKSQQLFPSADQRYRVTNYRKFYLRIDKWNDIGFYELLSRYEVLP